MKTNIFLGILFILLCYSTFKSFSLYLSEKEAKETAQRNVQAITKEAIYYKTETGNLAMKNFVIESSVKEIKADVFNISKELKNLNLKPGTVKIYSETGIETKLNFYTHLKDSIINVTDTLKRFDYKDSFLNFIGTIHNDTLKANYCLKDTLIQVCFKKDRYSKTGKKRPRWWIFAKKRIEQTITSKNPNTEIKYNKYIIVQ